MSKPEQKILLVVATGNAHKVQEIRAILGERFKYRTLKDFPNAPKVLEDANSFAGNAAKKAVELAEWLAENPLRKHLGKSDIFVLADDSGLEVDALGGAPGVHSARFAALDEEQPSPARTASNALDAANNAKLIRLLQDVPAKKRTGRFRCVLALAPVVAKQVQEKSPACPASETELETRLFDGVCEGRIRLAPKGDKGFGYDPLFVPLGQQHSFAELGEEVKNKISHRAKALKALADAFGIPRG